MANDESLERGREKRKKDRWAYSHRSDVIESTRVTFVSFSHENVSSQRMVGIFSSLSHSSTIDWSMICPFRALTYNMVDESKQGNGTRRIITHLPEKTSMSEIDLPRDHSRIIKLNWDTRPAKEPSRVLSRPGRRCRPNFDPTIEAAESPIPTLMIPLNCARCRPTSAMSSAFQENRNVHRTFICQPDRIGQANNKKEMGDHQRSSIFLILVDTPGITDDFAEWENIFHLDALKRHPSFALNSSFNYDALPPRVKAERQTRLNTWSIAVGQSICHWYKR